MEQSDLCSNCPKCGTEIRLDLGGAHRPFGDNEKMLYRLACSTCGFAFDVHFEDLFLREKS
jgi:hypothetical protein